MRRKDMEPGVLYAIRSNGMWRPGYVFDATHADSIRVRVYWTWPGDSHDPLQPAYVSETDYLNPTPDLLSPLAKYDDKRVKTNDVIQTWESWALAQRTERDQRLADHLAKEQQERDDLAAEHASNRQRLAMVDHLLEGHDGYLCIEHLAGDITYGWTQSRYSAKDVLELLESIHAQWVQR